MAQRPAWPYQQRGAEKEREHEHEQEQKQACWCGRGDTLAKMAVVPDAASIGGGSFGEGSQRVQAAGGRSVAGLRGVHGRGQQRYDRYKRYLRYMIRSVHAYLALRYGCWCGSSGTEAFRMRLLVRIQSPERWHSSGGGSAVGHLAPLSLSLSAAQGHRL